MAYVAGDEQVRALDVETGEEKWAVNLDDPTGALSPTLGGDVRIGAARYTASPGKYVGPMAVAGGRLYAFVTTTADDERRTELVACA